MSAGESAHGLWILVVLNSVVFIVFAFSFFKPSTIRDWRRFGTFSAGIVALFVEMYGIPLTLYVLAGWLQTRYPELDPFTHDAGHLWYALLGFGGNPHFNPIHIASNLLIVGGFVLLAMSWRVLYAAQRAGVLATTGAYAWARHPQYLAFALVMFGFLLQWPTLLTLAMFPVLIWMYRHLAIQQEQEVERQFGAEWRDYAARTPRLVPCLGALAASGRRA